MRDGTNRPQPFWYVAVACCSVCKALKILLSGKKIFIIGRKVAVLLHVRVYYQPMPSEFNQTF